jgi:2-polyprenyl-3-methyl-5-hydroxy-6-metoxy-1,4-benzoquinol methylase
MAPKDYLPADEYYADDFVKQQLQNYRDRATNHWKFRIDSVMDLMDQRNGREVKVLDLACGIGAFTMECAERGYMTVGVDYSVPSILTAKQLAAERGVRNNDFVIGDATQLGFVPGSFDYVVAADFVEHLFDEPLTRMFRQAYELLKPGGHMVIHTTPTRYTYLFSTWRALPLVPFAWLPQPLLDRFIEWYERYPFSFMYRLKHGEVWTELAARRGHCNCPSYYRLSELIRGVGFTLEKYHAGHAPVDFQSQPGLRWLSRVFSRSFHSRAHIWAVCRKPANT